MKIELTISELYAVIFIFASLWNPINRNYWLSIVVFLYERQRPHLLRIASESEFSKCSIVVSAVAEHESDSWLREWFLCWEVNLESSLISLALEVCNRMLTADIHTGQPIFMSHARKSSTEKSSDFVGEYGKTEYWTRDTISPFVRESPRKRTPRPILIVKLFTMQNILESSPYELWTGPTNLSRSTQYEKLLWLLRFIFIGHWTVSESNSAYFDIEKQTLQISNFWAFRSTPSFVSFGDGLFMLALNVCFCNEWNHSSPILFEYNKTHAWHKRMVCQSNNGRRLLCLQLTPMRSGYPTRKTYSYIHAFCSSRIVLVWVF